MKEKGGGKKKILKGSDNKMKTKMTTKKEEDDDDDDKKEKELEEIFMFLEVQGIERIGERRVPRAPLQQTHLF